MFSDFPPEKNAPDFLRVFAPSRETSFSEFVTPGSIAIVGIVEALPESKAGNHIGGQFIRSGTSPAPNYGEAQSAESRKDFVHKTKIPLKELRESMVWLKIIDRKSLAPRKEVVRAHSECNELIAIFVASTKTVTYVLTAPAPPPSKIKSQQSTLINPRSKV